MFSIFLLKVMLILQFVNEVDPSCSSRSVLFAFLYNAVFIVIASPDSRASSMEWKWLKSSSTGQSVCKPKFALLAFQCSALKHYWKWKGWCICLLSGFIARNAIEARHAGRFWVLDLKKTKKKQVVIPATFKWLHCTHTSRFAAFTIILVLQTPQIHNTLKL